MSDHKSSANRLNAKKSTGPRTARGKLHSKYNALKHGIHAKLGRIMGETDEDHDAMRRRWRQELEPVGELEMHKFETLIDCLLRLKGLEKAECSHFVETVRQFQHESFVEFSPRDLELLATHADGLEIGTRGRAYKKFKAWKEDSALPKILVRENFEVDESNRFVVDAFITLEKEQAEERRRRILDRGGALLFGFVPKDATLPFDTLNRLRKSLIREIDQLYGELRDLQKERRRAAALAKSQKPHTQSSTARATPPTTAKMSTATNRTQSAPNQAGTSAASTGVTGRRTA